MFSKASAILLSLCVRGGMGDGVVSVGDSRRYRKAQRRVLPNRRCVCEQLYCRKPNPVRAITIGVGIGRISARCSRLAERNDGRRPRVPEPPACMDGPGGGGSTARWSRGFWRWSPYASG